MRRIIAVVGPTATSKTAVAVHLAEHVGGEVINADSRQLYRGMDIGTAKPTPEEQQRVRHWLIDAVEPDETFSLGRYLDEARAALDDCWSRGGVPIVEGGTGQYVWALIEGWNVPRVPPDLTLRESLERQAESEGLGSLVAELGAADPAFSNHVDVKNTRRLIRAIEVLRQTGRTPSESRTRTPPDAAVTIMGLTCNRHLLYRRIDKRVDAMVEHGLFDEVEELVRRGFGCDLPAMSGIGYRQVCQHLAGELTRSDAIERIKTATHRLARMQFAWFRVDDERIQWIDIAACDPLAEALRIVESAI